VNNALEQYVQSRVQDAKFASWLGSSSQETARVIERYIQQLRPSANALKAILELARDIAARDDTSLVQVLGEAELTQVLGDGDLNKKDKYARIRYLIERKRFPEKAAVEDALHLLTKELLSTHGIRLELPDDLEGDSISMNLRFRSKEELLQVSERVSQLSKDERVARVFELLSGQD